MKIGLPEAHNPTNSRKTTEYRAYDSTRVVTIALYNPLTLTRAFIAFRMRLLSMKSHPMIMNVRRTTRVKEIEMYGAPN